MKLVDAKTIAEVLSVKPSWVYSNIERQTGAARIPFFRVGKHLRFDREAVAAWLRDQQRTDGNADA